MGGRIIRQVNEVGARLGVPRAGTLHIGEKRISPKTGKEYPCALDYFKASDDRGGSIATLFHRELGEKPQTIQVIFPSDDAELVCKETYEMRDSAGKVLAEGDGENFIVWNGEKRIPMTTRDYPDLMDKLAHRYESEWKVTLVLRFLVPAVRGVWGYWQLTTKGSASSIPQVRDVFDAFLERNGKISGVIFDLSVKVVKSSKPGDSSKFPVLSLLPNESEDNIRKVQGWLKPIDKLQIEDK